MYSTTWCHFCKQARAYFDAHHLAYVDKDVDHDPGAAKELHEKAAAAGISGSGVPVIDVGGTMLQGFSASAIEAALKKAGG
jgi:glutaredoxin